MRLFLLGATGNSGRRILKFALHRGYQVTAFVRNQNKLMEVLGRNLPQDLRVVIGDIENSAELAAAMAGHDAVINAAGYVTEGDRFTRLVQTVVQQTMSSAGAGEGASAFRGPMAGATAPVRLTLAQGRVGVRLQAESAGVDDLL